MPDNRPQTNSLRYKNHGPRISSRLLSVAANVTEDVQWALTYCFASATKCCRAGSRARSWPLHVFQMHTRSVCRTDERDGIVPAPYVARYHWVALERFDALKESELKSLIKNSYEMVLANYQGR